MSNVVINATQDAVHILFEGSDAPAQLERLRSLIERAQQRQVPPEELVAELEQGNSVWQRLGALFSQLLVPKDPGQFYGLLALLIAVWPLLQQPKEELTPEKVAMIVEAAVQQSVSHAAPVAAPASRRTDAEKKTHPAVKRKLGRNEPCPCASGKKYKRCCGGLASH